MRSSCSPVNALDTPSSPCTTISRAELVVRRGGFESLVIYDCRHRHTEHGHPGPTSSRRRRRPPRWEAFFLSSSSLCGTVCSRISRFTFSVSISAMTNDDAGLPHQDHLAQKWHRCRARHVRSVCKSSRTGRRSGGYVLGGWASAVAGMDSGGGARIVGGDLPFLFRHSNETPEWGEGREDWLGSWTAGWMVFGAHVSLGGASSWGIGMEWRWGEGLGFGPWYKAAPLSPTDTVAAHQHSLDVVPPPSRRAVACRGLDMLRASGSGNGLLCTGERRGTRAGATSRGRETSGWPEARRRRFLGANGRHLGVAAKARVCNSKVILSQSISRLKAGVSRSGISGTIRVLAAWPPVGFLGRQSVDRKRARLPPETYPVLATHLGIDPLKRAFSQISARVTSGPHPPLPPSSLTALIGGASDDPFGAYHPVFDLSSSPEPEALPSPPNDNDDEITTRTMELPSSRRRPTRIRTPGKPSRQRTKWPIRATTNRKRVVFLGSRDKGKGRAVEDSDDEVVSKLREMVLQTMGCTPRRLWEGGKSHVPKEVYGVSDSIDEESVEIIETYVEEGSGELSIRATGVPSVSEQNIGGQYDASFAAPIFVDDNGAIHQPIQNAVAGPSSNPQTRGYHQPRQDQQHIAVPFGNPVFPPNFESWMSDMRDVFRDALPNDINRQVQQVPIVDPGPTPALASRDYEERAYEGDDATCPIATSIEGFGDRGTSLGEVRVLVGAMWAVGDCQRGLPRDGSSGRGDVRLRLAGAVYTSPNGEWGVHQRGSREVGYTEGRALRPLRGGTDLGGICRRMWVRADLTKPSGYGARVCFDEGDGSGIVLATKGCVSGMVAGPYVEKQEGPGRVPTEGAATATRGASKADLAKWMDNEDPERDTRSARQVVKHPPHTIVCVYSAQSQPPDLATETRNFCSLIPAELRVASSLSNYPLSSSHLRSPDLLGNNISDMQISSFTLASTVHPVSRKSIRRLEAIQVRAHPASHKLVTRHPTCSSIQATQHVGVARNAHNHNTPGDLGAGAHWRKMASSQADTRRRTLKQPSSRVTSNSVPLRWTASMHDPANTSIGTAVTRGKDFCRDLVILGDPHRAHPGATVSSIWQVRHFYIPQHILTCLFAEKIAVLVVRVPEVRRSANPTGVPESVQYHRFTIGFVCALTPADFSLTVPHPPVLHLFCRHIRFMQTREK
ncbi:hypothetical protein DFP72DRAFT_1103315 [Ephemerocybe angulata]|uniref:Uncharacterized protein n=1 Tax=Ephemerocybe angulata TaxID=980116 RepID=A0A8H6HB16_9AGAR|nr:hypothetical protein DFP72DRAFT_1103315 [Tulosesus angulatus]